MPIFNGKHCEMLLKIPVKHKKVNRVNQNLRDFPDSLRSDILSKIGIVIVRDITNTIAPSLEVGGPAHSHGPLKALIFKVVYVLSFCWYAIKSPRIFSQ